MIRIRGSGGGTTLTGAIYEQGEEPPTFRGSPDDDAPYVWVCDEFYEVDSGGSTQRVDGREIRIAFERPMPRGFDTRERAIEAAIDHVRTQFARIGVTAVEVEVEVEVEVDAEDGVEADAVADVEGGAEVEVGGDVELELETDVEGDADDEGDADVEADADGEGDIDVEADSDGEGDIDAEPDGDAGPDADDEGEDVDQDEG